MMKRRYPMSVDENIFLYHHPKIVTSFHGFEPSHLR